MEYLQDLNKNQREAVIHENGPCLVIAGAGSRRICKFNNAIFSFSINIYSELIISPEIENGKWCVFFKKEDFNIEVENSLRLNKKFFPINFRKPR